SADPGAPRCRGRRPSPGGGRFAWAPRVMLAGVDPTDRIRQGVIAALQADARELLPPALADAAEPATGALVAELERFLALMRDYPERPGKTLRGRLLVLAARAHGAPDDAAAQTLAEALELFQN